jgi:UDP-glucose 6-dehydrogenase
MDRTSAELAKVGLNCSVTAKISMANTIGDVAVRLGADPDLVLEAIGSDSRIGNKYFKYGFGYGGPCFPRDNRAFIRSASQVGIDAHMNIACDKTNKDHLKYQIENFCKKNKKEDPVLITDVSYKKGFNMIEESQQLEFALGLARLGYDVTIKECTEVVQNVWLEYGDVFKYEVIK